MEIGIVVYSQTGNTLLVCEKLKEKLDSDGHRAAIERIEISGDPSKGSAAVSIVSKPALSAYEGIVFAAPVQAFSLALPMKKYMSTVSGLGDKKTACLVTKQLPFKWTGGAAALSQLGNYCKKAGSEPAVKDFIVWSDKQRDSAVDALVEKVSAVF